MRYPKLSIIVPVYDEAAAIKKVLERMRGQDLTGIGIKKSDIEVIVVDDGSTDGTRKILTQFGTGHTILLHQRNLGLTAAMMTGLREAKGEIMLVQHADLEYHPKDWPKLLSPILAGKADMVMGSRYLQRQGQRHFSVRYQLGGQGLTMLFNLLFGTKLTDIFTAHRAFTRQVQQNFKPQGRGFAFETELTAQTVKRGFNILEVPISYEARNFQQGKKLHWHAAFDVVMAMLRTWMS
ncbi:MAG: glycosyltransferase family 2 protein [Candidatus Chisholmbacteria bacterium]|nr:glycosyltransferase family 2 protein [Candidatus Chisholmbacteria bacterium]